MLKETETEETIGFFVTFLSLVASRLGGTVPPPPGYVYGSVVCYDIRSDLMKENLYHALQGSELKLNFELENTRLFCRTRLQKNDFFVLEFELYNNCTSSLK